MEKKRNIQQRNEEKRKENAIVWTMNSITNNQ